MKEKGFYNFPVLGFIIFMCLVVSCTKDDDCVSGSVDLLCLDDIGCTNTLYTLQVKSTNEFELIRSQEDYDRIISSACKATINWVTHDLIAGMINTPSKAIKVNKSLVKDCQKSLLRLNITVFVDDSNVPGRISFHALIPKLKLDEDLIVEVLPQ